MSNLRQFGCELECWTPNAASRSTVAAAITGLGFRAYSAQYSGTDYDVWQVKPDGSLDAQGHATMEVVAPILPGTQASLDQVTKVANWLSANGFDVNRTCGMHVHIDAADMTRYEAAAVALRYHHHQMEIDSVMPASRRGGTWAARLGGGALAKVERAVSSRSTSELWGHHERRVAVNLEHVHKGRSAKRIEFRQHSGTLNASKIIGWYKFLCDFVEETLRIVRSTDGSVTPTVGTPTGAPTTTQAPIVRRQRTARGTTRSVVVGTTEGPRMPQIDTDTDYDLFLRCIETNGVVTQGDARAMGWPDTRLRVTAHWLRRNGAELLTTQRNGELAYVGANGMRARRDLFSAPAQIRQRVQVGPISAPPPVQQVTAPAPAQHAEILRKLASGTALDGASEETKAWFNVRRSEIASAGRS